MPGNIDPNHAEMFFDDGKNPPNIGYGPSGVCSDDANQHPYTNADDNFYDDDVMRQALENLKDAPEWSADKYNVLTHNCQDFISALIEEYNRIRR